MPPVIAAALAKEMKSLRRQLGDGYEFFVTGLGTDRTSTSLDRQLGTSRPESLLFAGTAGQLDPGLEMGEVVVPAAWRLDSGTLFEVDADLMATARRAGLKTVDLGLTVHVPIVRAGSRRRRFEETGAAICDMESAAALMVAAAHQVPCLPVRVVSDTADTGLLGFYREFDGNMARLAAALEALLASLEATS